MTTEPLEDTEPNRCREPYPDISTLACMKPTNHSAPHATCLGYYAVDDESAWVEW